MECLERLTGASMLIPASGFLTRYGYPFRDVYAIRSGHVQASITYPNGYRRVLREYRPGELIGLDALLRGTYPADFVALARSTVCPIPLYLLEELVEHRAVDRRSHH